MDERDFRVMVGRRIAEFRDAAGMDQLTLAERAGIDNTRLCRIEKGQRPVDTLTLRRLSTALDVSVDALLEEERSEALVLARAEDAETSEMRRWAEELHRDVAHVMTRAGGRG
jgi:transcriptional regulator with XRE-family HTH domain